MADWHHGYVTDVPYTAQYHFESTPIWLATVAAFLNAAAPELGMPFRYADLGCGYGVTALVTAATMPHAEVWAFDFNPAHVRSGRDVARRAGLSNIHFEEASFEALANRAPDALPMFDYLTAHGVISWISPENRRHLFRAIGQRLAPGGIAYLSYNVATEWASMRPVRTLMRLLAEASPERTDLAVPGIFDLLDKMKQAGAAMFQSHPALESRLARIRESDPRYVAHELLNRDWHPLMFPEVASALSAIKCDYIGSATLPQNLLGITVPAELYGMFGEIRDPALRETVRDIVSAEGFRRDLYQRGPRWMHPPEQRSRTDAIGLVRRFAAVPEPIALPTPLGQFMADQARFGALLEALDGGPMTIGELRRQPSLADWPGLGLMEAVALLMGNGYLAPVLSGPPNGNALAATARLNRVHAALCDGGDSRPFLACPALAAAWHSDETEILALDAMLTGVAAEVAPLTDDVLDRLTRNGHQLRRQGEPVSDPAVAREIMTGKIQEMLDRRLPTLRQLGALGVAAGSPDLAIGAE